MKKNGLNSAGAAISILAIATAVISLLFLPDEIPVNWGLNNEIGYGSKYTILLMGAMPGALYFGLGALRLIDPKKENYKKFETAFGAMRIFTAAFIFLLQILTIISAFWPSALNISMIITIFTGFLICVMGNYMPKLRHNFFCGIRTPWTLSSESCWVKTHRFAGKLWVYGGLGICASAIFLKGALLHYTVLAIAIIALMAVPILFSYKKYKNKTD